MANASDILFYVGLFFLCFVTTTIFRSILNKRKASKISIQHPPGPPALPIIGHLHLLSSAVSKSFKNLSTQYGPIMRLRIVSSTAVVVSNAAVAKEFLKNNEMNFVSRPRFGASRFNIYAGSEFVNADYGPYWRFMKKLCMTELLSVPQVNRFVNIRRQEMMKLLENLVGFSKEGKACNLGVELMTMTNNIVCRMAMSTRCLPGLDESKLLWEFVKEILELSTKFCLGEMFGPIGKLDLFGYGRRVKAFFLKFDSLVEKIMVEHENDLDSSKKEKKDMMDILLQIYKDENAELKLTRRDIKCFIMELFLAGTDTVSIALQWTLAEIINHPKVFEKLREEINSVVGSKRLVEESDVPNLSNYLQAVVKESMRLHAPAPLMFRKCEKDCKINGYDILANERIIFNVHAIMTDSSSWENPLDFVPERFMVDSKATYDYYQMGIKGQNFNVLPFGSGRRGCPGASLALAVVHGMTAMLVQCFDFRVKGGTKINTEEGPSLSACMAHPQICYISTHLNPFELIVNDSK